MLQTLIVGLLASVIQGQRTPTISYITPSITTKIGGTIEMDCSVLYATEYPILWVKLPSNCEAGRETYNYRTQEADSCTPVPLSQGSALIITDTRFRYNLIIHTSSFSSTVSSTDPFCREYLSFWLLLFLPFSKILNVTSPFVVDAMFENHWKSLIFA